MSQGHGHVIPRPDGMKARCGGPALCSVCRAEMNPNIKPEPDALSILATEAAKDAQSDPEPDVVLPTGLAPIPGTGVSA